MSRQVFATNVFRSLLKHVFVEYAIIQVATFWGWRDQQLPDGTIILNSPSGKTYVTTPGSALLFPSLCSPTGDLQAPRSGPTIDYRGERTAMMPRRRRTRQQDRTNRIAAERRRNHLARTVRRSKSMSFLEPAPPDADDDPPPFQAALSALAGYHHDDAGRLVGDFLRARRDIRFE